MKKVISIVLVIIMTISLGTTVFAASEGWQHNNTGWWYRNADATYPKGCWMYDAGNWYHFDDAGYMQTGWLSLNGTWYYLDASGAMATGWRPINRSWYYMDRSGAMVTGWLNYDGYWYYLDASGAMATGWKLINGTWYYMDGSGAMATGWLYYRDIWYYLNSSGAMVTGWQKINDSWYYFDDSGRMYSNSYIDQKYFVDENGRWDGITMNEEPELEVPDFIEQETNGVVTFDFYQKGWYVARLEVKGVDKEKGQYTCLYTDSCAIGQHATLKVDTNKFDIDRVGYQIWFLGWDNDYWNATWSKEDYATVFYLSGYGDYPKFKWKASSSYYPID